MIRKKIKVKTTIINIMRTKIRDHKTHKYKSQD